MKIKSITKIPVSETHYDITVANDHNFFANNILTHNCNTSAVNAIIVGVNRGLNPVDDLDIIQMAGRCIDTQSKILMADGKYKLAKDIQINDLIYSIDSSNKLKTSPICQIFHSNKPARLIQFSNGTEITVSNHPLLSWNGKWLNSDSVQIGEKIAILANMPNHDENKQSFFSLFLEKTKNIKGRLRLTSEDFTKLKQLNNELDFPSHLEKLTYKTLKTGTTSIDTAKHFNFNFRYIRSKNGSEFDTNLLKDNKKFLWLLGMLATDGCIKITKTHTTWSFTQSKKHIFDEIISVLEMIGTKPYIDQHQSPLGNSKTWNCTISCSPLVTTMQILGFTPKKTKTLDVTPLLNVTNTELAEFIQGVIDGDGNITNQQCCRIYTASKSFAYNIKTILLQLGIRCSIKQDKSKNNLTNKINDGYNIFFGKEGILKLNNISTTGFKSKQVSKIKKLTRPLKGDLFYTKVSNITELENTDLINFSVLNTNTYIVEDVITHNCGRLGMAPYGNVFLICDSPSLWKQKIENPKSVTSTLLDTHALAFHLCAEIRNGIVFDANSMYQWYARTLASIQEPLEKEKVDDVLNSLQNWKAIKVLENGTFEITALGKVAATLYYHPEDVYHWSSCLKHMDNKNLWKSDLCLAYLVAAPTMQLPYIPKTEQEDVIAYMDSLRSKWGSGPKLKASSLSRDIHDLLGGSKPTPQCRPIQMDSERITGALTWISGILRVNKPEFFKILPIRLRYGCSEELSQLCMLPGIGIIKAKKLAAMGITTWQDIIKQPSKVQQVVGEKGLKKTVDTARLLMRRDYEM